MTVNHVTSTQQKIDSVLVDHKLIIPYGCAGVPQKYITEIVTLYFMDGKRKWISGVQSTSIKINQDQSRWGSAGSELAKKTQEINPLITIFS